MLKYIIALTISGFMLSATAQEPKMNFDLSEEMVEANSEKAQISITIEKENNILAKNTAILKNGKIYPMLQMQEDGELFGLEKIKQEQEIRKTNFLVQTAWHINKDKSIWVQLFIEEFDKKLGIINKEEEESGEKTSALEPAAIKNSYKLTLATVDDSEVKAQWGGYSFSVVVKRK